MPAEWRAAVAAYANPDGGYAGLLEPDVRTLSSQPVAVLTAFDVLAEVGAAVPAAATGWLVSITNDDGGIPFHLPADDGAPQAPWMQPSAESSLHMTAAVTAAAPAGSGPTRHSPSAARRPRTTPGSRRTSWRTRDAQLADGGWDVDWQTWAPAVHVEWRARTTVDALATLLAERRLGADRP